jgi:glyoxylate reductase
LGYAGAAHRQKVLDHLINKDAVIAFVSDRVDGEFLAAGGRSLQVVSNYAAGVDNVDISACSHAGVLVCNTPDVVTETTADMAWALLLACARRVVEGDRLVRSGDPWEWDPIQLLGFDVHGKTLGIVGLGRIGSALCRRANGFGMRVLACGPSLLPGTRRSVAGQQVSITSLDNLLACSDFISLHVSLSEATHHLIDERRLALLKPDAILVNTSRGALIDEAALVRVVVEGRIGGAALDVFEYEPEVSNTLLATPRVVLTPHLGSASVATRRKMTYLAVQNVLSVRDRVLPEAALNPEIWSAVMSRADKRGGVHR